MGFVQLAQFYNHLQFIFEILLNFITFKQLLLLFFQALDSNFDTFLLFSFAIFFENISILLKLLYFKNKLFIFILDFIIFVNKQPILSSLLHVHILVS